MNADDVRRGWAERSTAYSPEYYAYYGPNETSEAVRLTLDRHVDPDAAVLELGCSAGRHLKHLHDHGYRDLHGIDINDEFLDVMAEEYPELADDGRFRHDTIENAVRGFDDNGFEAVFTVETLQHIHADDRWLFPELVRITDGVLLTVECEEPGDGAKDDVTERTDGAPVNYVEGGLPLYYRDWNRIFTGLGLVEVESRTIAGDQLRAFQP